jgi:hypothetical protein
MTKRILTQEELKSQLHYDPDTGIFTRLVSAKNKLLGVVSNGTTSTGYIKISVFGVSYFSHRLAWLYMFGDFPEDMIDHVNGIKTDNRLKNLRIANKKENARNYGLPKNNTSGSKGVYWSKDRNKWYSKCELNGVQYHLGMFINKDDAIIARADFAKKHYGEFYRE